MAASSGVHPGRATRPDPHRDDRARARQDEVLAPGVEHLVQPTAQPELRVGDVEREQREHQGRGRSHDALGAVRNTGQIRQQEAQEHHCSRHRPALGRP
jgi:hypothetical protein